MKISMILLLSLILFTESCTCSKKLEDSGKKDKSVGKETRLASEELKWQILVTNRQCAMTEAYQKVVFTPKEFDASWDKISLNMDLFADKPIIDFDKKMVLFIAFGEINNGGHDLEINSIKEEGEVYKVNITHTVPGKNCMSSMAIEFPFWVFAVDKGKASKADFGISKKEKDCE